MHKKVTGYKRVLIAVKDQDSIHPPPPPDYPSRRESRSQIVTATSGRTAIRPPEQHNLKLVPTGREYHTLGALRQSLQSRSSEAASPEQYNNSVAREAPPPKQKPIDGAVEPTSLTDLLTCLSYNVLEGIRSGAGRPQV